MGYLQSRIVYYLMNLHIQPRKIYFARVRRGTSFWCIKERSCLLFPQTGKAINETSYKRDAELSPEGFEYAEKLKEFVLAYRAAQSDNTEDFERPLTV